MDACELSVEKFLADYVRLNRPIIVTGAMATWDIAGTWTPASLERRFGDRPVQVYNSYFDLQSLVPLRQYLSKHFGGGERTAEAEVPYVRWYTKLRDVDFYWADETFAQLEGCWQMPSFIPNTDYLLPYCPDDTVTSPVVDHFPAKGLFISPRGARTGLHVDPWGSCAILFQLYGTKTWYFYSPDQRPYLQNAFGVVDVTRPNHEKFPNFSLAQLTATCTLQQGEIIYVPHGWYHQVECDSDSVSVTWNFVHRTTAESFLTWLTVGPVSEFDESVLRFFYRIPAGRRVVEEVLSQIRAPRLPMC